MIVQARASFGIQFQTTGMVTRIAAIASPRPWRDEQLGRRHRNRTAFEAASGSDDHAFGLFARRANATIPNRSPCNRIERRLPPLAIPWRTVFAYAVFVVARQVFVTEALRWILPRGTIGIHLKNGTFKKMEDGVLDEMRPVQASPMVRLSLLDTLVGYHLRRVAGVFFADFSARLEPFGMRQGLFGILSTIGENPGINQGAAGRVLGIQRANMVSLVNELIDRGFVDRKIDADDRRAFALALTPAGEAALATATIRVREHEESLLADFTAQERTALIALLARLERTER